MGYRELFIVLKFYHFDKAVSHHESFILTNALIKWVEKRSSNVYLFKNRSESKRLIVTHVWSVELIRRLKSSRPYLLLRWYHFFSHFFFFARLLSLPLHGAKEELRKFVRRGKKKWSAKKNGATIELTTRRCERPWSHREVNSRGRELSGLKKGEKNILWKGKRKRRETPRKRKFCDVWRCAGSS